LKAAAMLPRRGLLGGLVALSTLCCYLSRAEGALPGGSAPRPAFVAGSLPLLRAHAETTTMRAGGQRRPWLGSAPPKPSVLLRFPDPAARRQLRTRTAMAASPDFSGWDSGKVAEWLQSEGFSEEWAEKFRENEIDGVALALLKDPDVLDRMGIPKPMGGRLKFWQKLDSLAGPKEAQEGAPVPGAQAPQQAAQEVPVPVAQPQGVESSPLPPQPQGTETLVRDAAAVAGASVEVPFQSDGIEALVKDEIQFVDDMCQLLADLDAKDRDVALLLDLKSNLQQLFSIVVVGEFNAGKSSLVNAILGSRFCKEGVIPTTTTINMLRYGDGEQTGSSQRNADYIELFLPVPLLKQVTIVDTPGTNAIIKEQTRLTKGFIPQSDLILFVTSAERPLTETEGKLLDYIQQWGKKVVMVLNKVDLFNEVEADIETVRSFVRDNAGNILGIKPPVYAVAGRKALMAKLGRADPNSDPAVNEKLWEESRFGSLEEYMVETLSNRKEAAKSKLETPLGVAERFLTNYDKASALGTSVTDEDIQVIEQVKQALEQYEASVEKELDLQIAKLDSVLNSVQRRAKSTIASVLSAGYISSNLVGCLTKSKGIEKELRNALSVDLAEELDSLVENFGKTLRDKQETQWLLCSALIQERLRNRKWSIALVKPDLDPIIEKLEQKVQWDRASSTPSAARQYDPEVETVLLGQSVTQKAFDVAVATSAVGGGGLAMLEVFNAGILDAAAFLATSVGLLFSLGAYPGMLQEDIEKELEQRAKSWKTGLKEEVSALLQEAAGSSVFEMEQAFKGYTDAVRTESTRWKEVAERVKDSEKRLASIRSRIEGL